MPYKKKGGKGRYYYPDVVTIVLERECAQDLLVALTLALGGADTGKKKKKKTKTKGGGTSPKAYRKPPSGHKPKAAPSGGTRPPGGTKPGGTKPTGGTKQATKPGAKPKGKK